MGALAVEPLARQTQTGAWDAGHTHGGEMRAQRKSMGEVKPS